MFKKVFSKFFSSSSNTAITESASEPKNVTPEEAMANWLSHPNEYGKKPVHTKVVSSGAFEIKFLPGSSMKYSLVEYKMSSDSPIEIGIVGEGPVWSFMNVLPYESIDREKLTKAYIGKLCQIIHMRLDKSNQNENKKPEQDRIEKLMISKTPGLKNALKITDVYKFNHFTIFLAEITEEKGKAYLPGIADQENYEMEEFFTEDDPMVSIAIYIEMFKSWASIK